MLYYLIKTNHYYLILEQIFSVSEKSLFIYFLSYLSKTNMS